MTAKRVKLKRDEDQGASYPIPVTTLYFVNIMRHDLHELQEIFDFSGSVLYNLSFKT